MAVAKVEALTRQLEELRRDRRGPLNLIPGNGANSNGATGASGTSVASVELEKLRRELMVSCIHYDRRSIQNLQYRVMSSNFKDLNVLILNKPLTLLF